MTSDRQKTLFLIMTLLTGVLIYSHFNNFQLWISEGDHGRDLYAAKMVMQGAVPYRDFFWPFGPLMPYYYSLFYRLFGTSIQSMLLGQNTLIIVAGMAIYLIASLHMAAPLAFACALWYWAFRGLEFFYTYNHIGGIVAILMSIYFLFCYRKTAGHHFLYFGMLSLFLLCLIRLNMGVFMLLAFFASACWADKIEHRRIQIRKMRLYVFSALMVMLLAAAVYAPMLYQLPSYIIKQCFPYFKSHRTDVSISVSQGLSEFLRFIKDDLSYTAKKKVLGGFLLLTPVYLGILWKKGRIPQGHRKDILFVFPSLLVFLLLAAHEFIGSATYYRYYWITPIAILIIFHAIHFCLECSPSHVATPTVRILLIITLFASPFFILRNQVEYIRTIKRIRPPLVVGETRVFTTQEPEWQQTIQDVIEAIQANVAPGEQFFAIPFDPLLYFLSGRDCATRQWIYFQHNAITESQEKETIEDLEKNNVRLISISKRADNPWESGFGVFGTTHCQILSQYIRNHFEPMATLGDWKNLPGWAGHYGVKIYQKRK